MITLITNAFTMYVHVAFVPVIAAGAALYVLSLILVGLAQTKLEKILETYPLFQRDEFFDNISEGNTFSRQHEMLLEKEKSLQHICSRTEKKCHTASILRRAGLLIMLVAIIAKFIELKP